MDTIIMYSVRTDSWPHLPYFCSQAHLLLMSLIRNHVSKTKASEKLLLAHVQCVPSWCNFCRYQMRSIPVFICFGITVCDFNVNVVEYIVHPTFSKQDLQNKYQH